MMENNKISTVSTKFYTEAEVARLLEVQRNNCYVAILSKTRNRDLAAVAGSAPEPIDGKWRKQKSSGVKTKCRLCGCVVTHEYQSFKNVENKYLAELSNVATETCNTSIYLVCDSGHVGKYYCSIKTRE